MRYAEVHDRTVACRSGSPCSPQLASALVLLLLLWSSTAQADNITLVGQLDPFAGNDRYADVWGAGNFAYISTYGGTGVGIIDITNPAAPTLAFHYNPGGAFQDVIVRNGIGYFSSDATGAVHIVNLANPFAPVLLGQITSAIGGHTHVHELFLDGNYLYEADSRTPVVKVFDVSNPAAPVFVRNILTTDPRFIHNMTAQDNRLYTAGWGGTTDIYDITDIGTTAPTLLGTVSSGLNGHSNALTADGMILVCASESFSGVIGDVKIFDVSNPASPALLATLTTAGLGLQSVSPHNPMIVGDLLFVSWYQAGLQVFNISDPSNPVRVGFYDTFPGPVSGFDGNWGVYPLLGLDRVLLSDLDGGLLIVDASATVPEPSTLVLSGVGVLSLVGFGWSRCRRSKTS